MGKGGGVAGRLPARAPVRAALSVELVGAEVPSGRSIVRIGGMGHFVKAITLPGGTTFIRALPPAADEHPEDLLHPLAAEASTLPEWSALYAPAVWEMLQDRFPSKQIEAATDYVDIVHGPIHVLGAFDAAHTMLFRAAVVDATDTVAVNVIIGSSGRLVVRHDARDLARLTTGALQCSCPREEADGHAVPCLDLALAMRRAHPTGGGRDQRILELAKLIRTDHRVFSLTESDRFDPWSSVSGGEASHREPGVLVQNKVWPYEIRRVPATDTRGPGIGIELHRDIHPSRRPPLIPLGHWGLNGAPRGPGDDALRQLDDALRARTGT